MSDFSNLKAYNGNEPYIFVSYAHRDSDRVLPIVDAMQKQGLRIWFDMGIEAGTEWSNNIAKHLRECSAFVFFASKNSVASENCLDEVAYSKTHQKASLMVFLEDDVILPEGTEMQTARYQRMYMTRHKDLTSAVEKICEAPILLACGDFAQVTPAVEPRIVAPVKQRKKPWLWIVIGAAAALLVGVILLISLLGGGKNAPSGGKENTPNSTTGKEKLSLSDDLMDFTFVLEGKFYQLPADLREFTDAGWELTMVEPVEVRGLGFYAIEATKGDSMIHLELHNPSGNVRDLEECCVSGIRVYADEGVSFQIAKEIEPGVDVDAVLNAFGMPQYRYDGEDTVNLEYNVDESAVTFHCSVNGKGMPYIRMNRRDIAPEFTETSMERPEYLDEYVAPTELGDDLGSGIFQLEDQLYAIPAPLEAFLNNGWTIAEGTGYVVAYGEERVKLTLGDVSVDVTLLNASDLQTIPENCIVKRISVYESDDTYLKLPNGVDVDSTAAEAAEGMAPYTQEDDINDYDDSIYYFARFDDELTVQVSVNKSEDEVAIIDIYC